MIRRILALTPAMVLASFAPFVFAQTAPPASTTRPAATNRPAASTPSSTPAGMPSPMHSASESSEGHFYAKSPLSLAEEEVFIQRANIVSKKALETGITKTTR